MDRVRAVLCSRNRNKARELEHLLAGWSIEPLDATDWPEETGETYLDNARIKARFGHEVAGSDRFVLGEDSGLEVAALGGRPGVHSARYAPEGAPAIARLLSELDGVADRAARYVCELVCITPGGRELRGTGTLAGRIVAEPRGTGGFGYDPVFLPDGEELTVAELGNDWKERNSHRARAAHALLAALAAALLLVAGAACGGASDPTSKHALSAFFTHTPRGRTLGQRFPHTPGTRTCIVDDSGHEVQATCATDVSLVKPTRAVVTLTEAWNHGANTHTWFFFIKRTGEIESVVQEGSVLPSR
jgi:XTP/dITP diphosphohydrolase